MPLKAPGTKRGHRTSKNPAPTPTFQNPHPNGALSPLEPPLLKPGKKAAPQVKNKPTFQRQKQKAPCAGQAPLKQENPQKASFGGMEDFLAPSFSGVKPLL